MKTTLPLLLAILVGAAVGATTGTVLSARDDGARSAAAQEAEGVLELARMRDELARLGARQAELARTVDALRLEPAPAAARTAPLTREDIEGVVASYLASHPAGSESSASSPPGGDEALRKVEDMSVAEIMDLLQSGELGGIEEQEFWQLVRRAGRIDDVVAQYELMAERDPHNPDVQTDLGTAYLQKIFDVGSGPLAGKYGTLADEAFDRALEADPLHWQARFSKAVALSNWPEFLGKTGEAIHQFETLVEQQEAGTQRPEHAQTYFILGNMYQRRGDTELALETWRRGLALFPDDQALREQIRVNG